MYASQLHVRWYHDYVVNNNNNNLNPKIKSNLNINLCSYVRSIYSMMPVTELKERSALEMREESSLHLSKG